MEPDERKTQTVAARRRPTGVTLLAIGVLTFAGINLIRLVGSLQQREFLAGLLPISPFYLSISGLVWLVVGCILAWGLWLGRRWAIRATLVGVLAYSLYYWIGRPAKRPRRGPLTFDEDVNVEVSCPQQHQNERRVVAADLTQQLKRASGPVRVAIAMSHPTTGSGRTVTEDGQILRDPKNRALAYPACKLLDRLLHTKRDGASASPV